MLLAKRKINLAKYAKLCASVQSTLLTLSSSCIVESEPNRLLSTLLSKQILNLEHRDLWLKLTNMQPNIPFDLLTKPILSIKKIFPELKVYFHL